MRKIKTHDLSGAALDWAVLEIVKPYLSSPESARIEKFGPVFSKGYYWPCYRLTKTEI